MHLPTKNYCCVVPPVVAHFIKNAKGGILKCVAQTKMKAQSRRRHCCCLCYCCSSIAAAVLLLLCYSHQLGLICVPTVQLHRSYTRGTSCSPQNIRKTTVLEK